MPGQSLEETASCCGVPEAVPSSGVRTSPPEKSVLPRNRSHPFAEPPRLMGEARARRRPSFDAGHHAARQLLRQ